MCQIPLLLDKTNQPPQAREALEACRARQPLDGLLAGVARGDSDAVGRAFLTYAPYLRKVIRRRLPDALRSKLDSDDVMQSAWRDILGRLRDGRWHFETPAQLQAFLARGACNRLIDHCRASRRPMEQEQPLEACAGQHQLTSPRP